MAEFSLEKSQEIADKLIPILQMVDAVLVDFDIEYALQAVARMRSDMNTAESASVLLGPQGLDQVDDGMERVHLFEALIEVFKIRKRQRVNKIKRAKAATNQGELLRKLGIL